MHCTESAKRLIPQGFLAGACVGEKEISPSSPSAKFFKKHDDNAEDSTTSSNLLQKLLSATLLVICHHVNVIVIAMLQRTNDMPKYFKKGKILKKSL